MVLTESHWHETNNIFPFSTIINSSVVVAVFQSTHALHIWPYVREYVHGGLVANCHQMECRALSEILSFVCDPHGEAYQCENLTGCKKKKKKNYRCKKSSISTDYKLLMALKCLTYSTLFLPLTKKHVTCTMVIPCCLGINHCYTNIFFKIKDSFFVEPYKYHLNMVISHYHGNCACNSL